MINNILNTIQSGKFVKCDICDETWHKGCMCCRKSLANSEELKELEIYVKLEEELGIDLITFINILKAGKLYHKEFGWLEPDLYFFDTDNPNNWSLDTFDTNSDIRLLYFRDYGKTWALTKEALL